MMTFLFDLAVIRLFSCIFLFVKKISIQNMMSKKRKSRKNVEAAKTTKRVKSDSRLLWRLVTDHPDIFDTHGFR